MRRLVHRQRTQKDEELDEELDKIDVRQRPNSVPQGLWAFGSAFDFRPKALGRHRTLAQACSGTRSEPQSLN
jgi:hypothetical protein